MNNRFYRFLLKTFKNSKMDSTHIGSFFITAVCTSIIMWLYALIEIFYMDCMPPKILGVSACILHSFTIILVLWPIKYSYVVNYLLSTCVFHQIVFTYFSGGAESNLLIWFTFLPILAGLNINFKSAVMWGGITIGISFMLILFNRNSVDLINHLHEDGLVFSRIILHFGFIIFCTLLTYFYLKNLERNQIVIRQQQEKVENLFKVLFHDLANPLTKIGLGLSLVKRNRNPMVIEKSFQIIEESYQGMYEVTHNVRKMYAISKGKECLELSYISLNECIEYIRNQISDELEKKSLKLVYDFEGNKELEVLVDPISFKHQVLINLLNNAIKFSYKAESIFINAHLNQEGFIQIDIKDQGIGIPKELIPQLFQIDKKTNRNGTHNEKGTGFGLIIVKSFIELYGGTIEVSSSKDISQKSGTTFSLNLKGKYAGAELC